MTEKLQNQSSSPKSQSRFEQFKSAIKQAKAKVEDFVFGDSIASDKLKQEMEDLRYETARLQRKAEREAKGQTFEQAVLEDIAKKELAKKQGVMPTVLSPLIEQNDKKLNSTNTTLDRVKALAGLAILSGSMMIAPIALANKNSSVENNSSAKVTETKQAEKKTVSNQNSGYTSTKFKYSIPNVDASTIKTGSIINEYLSNGISFKGRFVMMPNGALFNLQGRSVKITSKNIYAIENDRSGYFNLNDSKTVKKVTHGQKISILDGKIIMVPDVDGSKKTEARKKEETTILKRKQEVLKPKLIANKGENAKNPIKVDKTKTALINKQEKPPTSVTAKYLDPSTGTYISQEVIDPKFIAQVVSHKFDHRKAYLTCDTNKPEILNTCSTEIYELNGQKYWAESHGIKGSFGGADLDLSQHNKWTTGKIAADKVKLIPFDPTKPQNIINLNPYIQTSYPTLIKAKYWGRNIYFRPYHSYTESVNESIAKGEPMKGILVDEIKDFGKYGFIEIDPLRIPFGREIIVKKGWNGELEIHDFHGY